MIKNIIAILLIVSMIFGTFYFAIKLSRERAHNYKVEKQKKEHKDSLEIELLELKIKYYTNVTKFDSSSAMH
jgi:hypothetical protein